MLAYIPDEWLRNPESKDKVLDIFADIPDTDVLSADSDLTKDVEKRLSGLGEDIILEHYREGYFSVG